MKYYYTMEYLPVRYNGTSEQVANRKAVWNFKDGNASAAIIVLSPSSSTLPLDTSMLRNLSLSSTVPVTTANGTQTFSDAPFISAETVRLLV